jgi:diguanylate cyclase (GGDEF)-like protein
MRPGRLRRGLAMAALLLPLLAAADDAARTAAVQAVLDDFAQRGSGRAVEALQRLREAGPPPDSAPQALRQRYYAAIASEAAVVPDVAARRAALAVLQAMAAGEGCEPCTTELVLAALDEAMLAQSVPRIREVQAQLAARPPAQSPRDRFNVAYAHASALERMGDAAAALEAALEAARLAADGGSAMDQMRSLSLLAYANMLRRDFRAALRNLDEAMARARAIGNDHRVVGFLIDMSYAHAAVGDRPRVFAALQEGLALARRLGDRESELTALNNLAHYYNGDPSTHAKAYAHALEGEKLARRLDDPVMVAFTRTNRGVAMVRLGQAEAGIALAREGVAAVRARGLTVEAADLLEQLSIAYEAAGRHGEAITALREQLLLLEQMAQRQHDTAAQELQDRFDADRRALEIERLQVQQQRSQAEAATRSLQQRVWAVAALALVLAGVLIGRGLVRVRQRSRRLQAVNARLDEQASRDALTGAFNRRHAEQLLAAEPAEATGLVLLDVDHFKQVNDRHGHAAGDAVLQAVAQRLQTGLRGGDALVRWGGEEFLLLLPGCDADALAGPVARALARLGEEAVTLPDGTPLRVTASAGACVWPASAGQPWQAAMQRADEALYAAKQAGRNRGVCILPGAAGPVTVSGP